MLNKSEEIQVRIINEILDERKYQDTKWGQEFDDKNTLNDWITYVNVYLAKAAMEFNDTEFQRKRMIQAVSILVAALETFDRNKQFASRHYDE